MRTAGWAMVACLSVLAGGCSSSAGPENAPPDPGSPIVWISYPPSNAVIGDEVTVVAEATDSRAISRVEFLVDREIAYADSTPPYEFTWSASDQPTASVHVLSAIAWNSAGDCGRTTEMPVHCRWRRFIRDENEMWGGDIDFVYVRSTATLLEFRVGINGHWNDPHDPEYGIDIGILMDVDQDQSTGLNEYTPGWYPPNDIGADFGASVGWEGDALWIWNEADTLWVVHGDYAYTSIPNSGSRFDVGIYRADIGNPSAIDVVAVGAAVSFDWAPDTGHATYLIDGLYVGGDTTLPYVPGRALPPEETQGGLLWQHISPG